MGFDRALLQRFRDGETEALAEVYRGHAGILTRLLRAAAFRGQSFATLRSAMELENAIVEVFTRAFEPRARQVYDGQRPYEHFLMGIARNYLLELARNREHPTGLELSEEVDAALSLEQTDVHEALEDREVKTALRILEKGCTCPPELPMCGCGKQPQVKLFPRGAVRPADDECATNPRRTWAAPPHAWPDHQSCHQQH